jgi:hypothetical protein
MLTVAVPKRNIQALYLCTYPASMNKLQPFYATQSMQRIHGHRCGRIPYNPVDGPTAADPFLCSSLQAWNV